jgi:hypothetical protein
VFNRFAYRDKKVVGVCAFWCAASMLEIHFVTNANASAAHREIAGVLAAWLLQTCVYKHSVNPDTSLEALS